MIGIYKIENLINNKCYIGQSIHINRRWSEHISLIGKCERPLYMAFEKYGIENFSFEIIEECYIEDLNYLEEKYITIYNSISPYGYNLQASFNGTYTVFNLYDYNIFLEIIKDIKEENLQFKEIAEKYSLSTRTIGRLNRGETHRIENEKYPLRNTTLEKMKFFCCDCGIEITTNSNRCRSCSSKNQQRVERPTREELKKLIRSNSFISIAKEFKVTDNAIRKWCVAMKLPKTKNEINSYSNEEWDLI